MPENRVLSLPLVLKTHLSKESVKSLAIISAENKTGARIYGTICASHRKGNGEKVLEATRQHVRSKEDEKTADTVGQPTYCKP